MLLRSRWRVLHVPLNLERPNDVPKITSPRGPLIWSLIWSEWIMRAVGIKSLMIAVVGCAWILPIVAGTDGFWEAAITGERNNTIKNSTVNLEFTARTIGSPDRDLTMVCREECYRTANLPPHILGSQMDMILL
jgi:hypothetical protein